MATEKEDKENSVNLPKILVVDDDEIILKQIKWALVEEYNVYVAQNRTSALEIFVEENIPVVLLDLGLPPHPAEATEGILTLEDILAVNPLAKVVIVSGNSEKHNALRAIEKGAHDIFSKPVNLNELRTVLHRVYKRIDLEKESGEERSLAWRVPFEDIIGNSLPMKEVYSTIRKVADTDVPILILGESGTGKELVANVIHSHSPRKDGPFVAINCSAIPETLLESELFGHERGSFTGAFSRRLGKLEFSNGGTLFLDEIGDLAPDVQVKLLRFLQEKVIERIGGRESIPVDIRIIAATHKDLQVEVGKHQFREDLYFRLAVVSITLPPLRKRGEDIIQLAEHLAASFCKEMKKPPVKFSKPALQALRSYAWPGNVRELQNKVKQALVLSDGPIISLPALGLEETNEMSATTRQTLREAKKAFERNIVSRALQENNRNISKAAKSLGISRPTLYEIMSRYSL